MPLLMSCQNPHLPLPLLIRLIAQIPRDLIASWYSHQPCHKHSIHVLLDTVGKQTHVIHIYHDVIHQCSSSQQPLSIDQQIQHCQSDNLESEECMYAYGALAQ